MVNGKSSLSTNQAFTSHALVMMVASPAQRLLAIFWQAGTAGACYGRIQKFLLDPSREDKRIGGTDSQTQLEGTKYADEVPNRNRHAVNGNGNGHGNILDQLASDIAISVVNDATIRPAKTAEPALVDISIQIKKSAICLDRDQHKENGVLLAICLALQCFYQRKHLRPHRWFRDRREVVRIGS